jgi:hypothetical protein
MDRYNHDDDRLSTLSAAGLVIAVAGLFIVVLNVAPILAYAQNSSSSAASSPILSKNSQSGSLTSLQHDATTGKTNWIISGVYKMNNINTANPMFNATFYMMKTDGTAPHKHTVSDFKISGKPVVANNSTTFNGTSTVTMKEGPVKDVPTSIKFTDGSGFSLWFDPSKTKSHFGNTVIYGTQHLICKEMPNYCQ